MLLKYYIKYNKNDITELILQNNLYGLDIDDRAGQLSVLSIVLKAREYDKSIFNKEVVRKLNIMSIQESNSISDTIIDNISNAEQKENAQYLFYSLKNAKEIGSLLLLENRDYKELENIIENDNTIFGIEMKDKILPLIRIANILSNKYEIVVTNPPYMNQTLMSNQLKQYIKEKYGNFKTDLFSAFIIKNAMMVKEYSYLGFMTPMVWMFISSYEPLRNYILNDLSISSLIQLEYSALEEATVPICSFILSNNKDINKGIYFRLSDFIGGMKVQEKKYIEFLHSNNCNYKFYRNSSDLKKIPSCPIAYWASDNMIRIFKESKELGSIIPIKQGIATADNNRFLRLWYEVNIENEKLNSSSVDEAENSIEKWYPYNKGGVFRKWYGNNDYIVNWENDGYEIKNFKDDKGKLKSRPQNLEYCFKKSVTWSLISSGSIAFRSKPFGHIFDVAGMSCFPDDDIFLYILGLNNTKIINNIMKFIAPTLNYQVGDIAKIPVIYEEKLKYYIDNIVEENINISKEDWDSFETSWDFTEHPLLKNRSIEISDKKYAQQRLSEIYTRWEQECNVRFNKLKQNEEELNRIFIEVYRLQDELTPEVEDKDITVRKADKAREIKSLISYAVGCMFGRYSLDEEGLIYAGGEFSINRYKLYKPDIDNIIPITDEAYFGDDIVERFKEFIKTVYGRETFNENLDFIAETLGKRGTETSEDTIRRYFNNDFYSYHIKTYQKKPIYWLFDSGKKDGFKALIYMHRYYENIVPKVRLDYLHRMQTTYERLLSDVNYKLTTELSMNEKKEAQKRQVDLNAKLQEIKVYDEKIAHIANQRVNIDLDDGVTVNYAKFADILAKIK